MKKFLCWTLALFLTFSLGGWVFWQQKPTLKIAEYTGFESTRPLEIVFSQSMDPDSVLENLYLKPNIPGKFLWKNKTTLTFIPDSEQDMKTDENITIYLGATTKDAWGRALEKSKKINFSAQIKTKKQAPKLIFSAPENVEEGLFSKIPISFLWDQSLFPLEQADKSSEKLKKIITLTPPIKGVWSVIGTSGILFEPEKPWPQSTKVTVEIPASLVGEKIEKTFETRRVERPFKNFHNSDLINQKPILLHFNQPLDITQLRPLIHLTTDPIIKDRPRLSPLPQKRKLLVRNPKIAFDLEYGTQKKKEISPSPHSLKNKDSETRTDGETLVDKTQIKIIPRENWEENQTLRLVIKKGAYSLEGPLPTKETTQFEIQTITPFSLDIDSKTEASQGLRLRFSHPLDPKVLAQNFTLSPDPEGKMKAALVKQLEAQDYETSSFYFAPPFNYWPLGKPFTLEVSGHLTDIYDRPLGENQKITFIPKFKEKYIRKVFFPEQGMVFPPEVPLKIAFNYSGEWQPNETQKENLFLTFTRIAPEPETLQQNFSLEEALLQRKILDLDLKETFPQFLKNGKFKPGLYHLYMRSDNKSEYQSKFFISDFSVALKRNAKGQYQISAETFDGKPIEGKMKIQALPSLWNYYSRSKTPKNSSEKLFQGEIQIPATLNNKQKNYPHQNFMLQTQEGRIGIGSESFAKKMGTHDAKGINYAPYLYKASKRGLTLTDRPLYRPGDTVFFKSIFRSLENFGKQRPLKEVLHSEEPLPDYKIEIFNTFGETVFSQTETPKNGSLHGSWEIPQEAKLGNYEIGITSNSFPQETDSHKQNNQPSSWNQNFQVLKYRKPKFLIQAHFNQKKAIINDQIEANITAQYAFGGKLKNKKINYTITLLGSQKNCWWWCEKKDFMLKKGEGVLDQNGQFLVPIDLAFSVENRKDIDFQLYNWNTLTLNTTIQASEDEKSSKEISIPFFLSNRILTLDPGDYFYDSEKEKTISQSGHLSNLEKNPISENITATLGLQTWVKNDKKGVDGDFYRDWKPYIKNIWKQEFQTDESGNFMFDFETPKPAGNYVLEIITQDEKGRKNSESRHFWISGKDLKTAQTNDENRILSLIANKPEYKIGDTVEIFFPLKDFEIFQKTAQATIERGEVLENLDINFKKNTVQFKVEDWMVPNVYVSVLLSGKKSNGNPDVFWGSRNITITDESKKLEIQLEPNKSQFKPGETVTLNIKTQTKGIPKGASVMIAVVDETLLALKARQSLDLWKFFLTEVPLGVSTYHTLTNFISVNEMEKIIDQIKDIKARESSLYGGGAAFADNSLMQKNLATKKGGDFTPRGNFLDTAFFQANVQTNQNGEGSVQFTLPDNVTKWHIWAIGDTKNNTFGEGETFITASLPLLMTEIFPNAFQVGDALSVGVLVNRPPTEKNKQNEKTELKVRLKLPDGIIFQDQRYAKTGENIQEKTINIGDEARIFFDLKVMEQNFDFQKAFEIKSFQFEIETESGEKDALKIERKVFPPKISLSVADFIRVEDSSLIPVFPDAKNALESKLKVTLSPSVTSKLGTLIDRARKTNYGCSEQRLSYFTSRLWQDQFDKTLGRMPSSPEDTLDREALLESRDYIHQSFFGNGFGYWSGNGTQNAWVTARILDAAEIWAAYDTPFDEVKIKLSQTYLKKVMNKKEADEPHDTLRNYIGYVLAKKDSLSLGDLKFLTGYTDSTESKIWWLWAAQELKSQGSALNPVLQTYEKELWKSIKNRTQIRDRIIFWEESKPSFYSQKERLTALIFKLILENGAFREYHHKIAHFLAETNPEKLSGVSSLRVLEAMTLYARNNEIKNFGSKVALQDLKDRVLTTGTLEKIDQEISFEKVFHYNQKKSSEEKSSKNEIIEGLRIKTQNKKPFYANIELQEMFLAKDTKPVSKGFFIQKDFFELEDENLENPVQKLKVGKNYRVRIQIVNNSSHDQIIIEDFIPSGAEFINFDLDNSSKNLNSSPPHFRNFRKYYCSAWCSPPLAHKEFHETKARFFMDHLPIGTHQIEYIIQTRLQGDFEILPTKIQEMYFPEAFSTTQGESIKIES